jgi:hypothetical protein
VSEWIYCQTCGAVTSNDVRCDSCERQDEGYEPDGTTRPDGTYVDYAGNEWVELHGAELEAARAADPDLEDDE